MPDQVNKTERNTLELDSSLFSFGCMSLWRWFRHVANTNSTLVGEINY